VSFKQLYYTSCENGLSGYAGYQFNAVTSGTSAETMRTVEALTSYEPPRSLAQSSSPEELARCPVNLCYAPGATTVLASVSYVGRDSSNRVGNFFAHALAADDLDADDPELLPIELWRAPWWQRTTSPDPVLPGLAGPLRTGPLSRDEAARFLGAHPHGDKLTALLTAAGLAQTRNDRSVLVVAESADEVALWFAAVSYLLPPALVRRLSFSTYLSRPSRSGLHLLGTLPETNLDLGPDASERFYLFDFPGQRFPALPVHPLARLCAAIGLTALPALWGWADALASRREVTADEWYPVVGAAAALGRVPLTADDLAAVAAWLGGRDDLERKTRNAIAGAVHGQPAVTDPVRRALRDISVRTGDADLWERVQYELLEPSLRARADGAAAWAALTGTAVPAVLAPSAARVRDQLTATAEEELRLADNHADTLSLLDWSCQAGLPVAGDILAECGRTLVGPLIAADDGKERLLPAARREQATRVTERWPQVREGMVRYLSELAVRDPAEAASAMSGLASELLTARDVEAGSPIWVFYLVCDAVRRQEDPVATLAGLVRRQEISETDELLLRLLWPGGGWTVTDAARVLREVDARALGGTADWFEATVAVRPEAAGYPAYAKLCADLMASPLADGYAARQRPALREVHDLWRACGAAQRVTDLRAPIRATADGTSAPAAVLSGEWVAARVVTLPASRPAEIVTAFSGLRPSARHKYLTLVRSLVKHPADGAAMHAAALYVLLTDTTPGGAWADPYRERINGILIDAINWWHKDQLEQIARLLDGVRAALGNGFRSDIGLVRAGRFGGVLKAARFVRGLLPGPKDRGQPVAAIPQGTVPPGGAPSPGGAAAPEG
jgi:hypothetical protein